LYRDAELIQPGDGTFDATCDSSRAYTNISDILSAGGADDTLSYMKTYWKDYQGQDEQFWEHEWGKHGTCISTIDPSCYTDYQPTEEAVDFFKKTVELFKTLPSYQWLSEAGITPSASATYSSADIQSALKAKHGKEVTIGCKNGALDEIWYHYNVQGSIIGGNFVAADPDGTKSTCPDTGVKYLPKSGGSSGGGGGSSTSTMSTSGSSPTGTPFSGKGQLKVYSGSSQTGCIISSGSWFTTGTCASFTAAASGGSSSTRKRTNLSVTNNNTTGNGFTLSSSKGKCGVSGEALTCGSGVTATVFTTSGGNLAYNGSTKFYADAAPTGSTQATVHTGSGKVELSIVWG
jgi:ribonuclease T2